MKENIIKFFRSFKYAAAGLAACVRRERNMRFHLCAGVTALWLGGFYELSGGEKCALFIVIMLVIAAEAVNTAVEAAVDISGERSPMAGLAKDCAAGAVLVCAVGAVCCGIVLFWDREVFREIFLYFRRNIFACIMAAGWVIFSVYFIFGMSCKQVDQKKN